MNRLLTLGIGLIAALVLALIFEDSREWLMDALEYIISFEWFGYLISFEWIGDLWELIVSLFEGIGEFSITGLIFGVAVVIFVYLLRNYMLNPFLVHMGPLTATFWMIVTYVGCGIMGYLVGKRLFGDD